MFKLEKCPQLRDFTVSVLDFCMYAIAEDTRTNLIRMLRMRIQI